MKLSLFFIALTFTVLSNAQQLKTPAPSPTQVIKQDFGIGNVELSYSRPSLKGRKYFEENSELAPVGKVWRTGANSATTFLTIPGKDEWTLIITTQTDVTNPNDYKQDKDVVRVKAKPASMGMSIENFTMQFANITNTSCELHLMWGTTAVALPISTDADSKIMAQIDKLVKSDNRPYFNAASYYANNNKDLNQALAWFDKAIEQTPEGYWIYHEKANCLVKLGKKAEAKAAAQKSLELATKAKDDAYIGRNQKLLSSL
ncbi:MAG: DUF2911 domain-containing protein [Sphingobacteriales bacterium]|nr:DUF2911 domain-containing protein [Sphingobacteriales bacterium]